MHDVFVIQYGKGYLSRSFLERLVKKTIIYYSAFVKKKCIYIYSSRIRYLVNRKQSPSELGQVNLPLTSEDAIFDFKLSQVGSDRCCIDSPVISPTHIHQPRALASLKLKSMAHYTFTHIGLLFCILTFIFNKPEFTPLPQTFFSVLLSSSLSSGHRAGPVRQKRRGAARCLAHERYACACRVRGPPRHRRTRVACRRRRTRTVPQRPCRTISYHRPITNVSIDSAVWTFFELLCDFTRRSSFLNLKH